MTDGSTMPDQVQDVSFADPEFLRDPWTPTARLQAEAPVFFSQNQQGWIISRYDDVRAALADKRFSSARADQVFRNMPEDIQDQVQAVQTYGSLFISRLDGRDHIRIRSLLLKAFDQASVRRLDSLIGKVVDEVLADCERIGEFDFMEVVSAKLPTRIMQHLFGLPDEYQPLLFQVASDFIAAISAATVTPDLLLQLDRSIRAMNEIFSRFIPERETAPGDDLISMMVHARDGLNKLSNDEMLAQLYALLVAGAETTANSLATQVRRVASQPHLQEILRTTPERAFDLTTELLRYPGTVKCLTRYAAQDIELHGQLIRKGDLVWIMNAGANTDTRKWEDPFESVIDRPNIRDSMAFGPGMHFCIGHMLARSELSTFLTRAFTRFDIDILQEDFEMVPSYVFYGYRELRVRFTPRTAAALAEKPH